MYEAGFLKSWWIPSRYKSGFNRRMVIHDLDVEDLTHVMPPAHFNVGEDRNALRAWPSALLLGVQ